jgi:hypothetical protein
MNTRIRTYFTTKSPKRGLWGREMFKREINIYDIVTLSKSIALFLVLNFLLIYGTK